jgi:serine/threonine-protein kinase
MIAAAETRLQPSPGEARRVAAGELTASGMGSNVTYVLGSVPTQLSLKSPHGALAESIESCSAAYSVSDKLLKPGMDFGPFRLLRRLGQGAQGNVWKAKRLGPNVEIVALKILNPSLVKHAHRLAQFRREAERGARLDGPSLLQVFEFGEVNQIPYMSMPFVEGTTLQQVIKARRDFLNGRPYQRSHRFVEAEETAYLLSMVRIMAKAARGLDRVHASRVVHRDIKPANILLDRQHACGVYLCDLGLGRDLEIATVEQMRDGAGTPIYMAPERLLKAPANEILCDIYSLGVTLFESLTLERPWEVPSGMPLACLSGFLVRTPPRQLREARPDLPEDLELIIARALSRNPQQRQNSAIELAGDLERCLVRWSFRERRTNVEGAHRGFPARHEQPRARRANLMTRD